MHSTVRHVSLSDGPRTTDSNCLGFCLVFKDITQYQVSNNFFVSLLLLFLLEADLLVCRIHGCSNSLNNRRMEKVYDAFYLINDFDKNLNKILTLDIQIDHHRTVSNFIACLTSVITMLTSRRVIKLKDSIVANTRSVWKCPTN